MTRRRRKVRRRTIKLDQRRRHELNVAAQVKYALLGYGSLDEFVRIKRKEMREYGRSIRLIRADWAHVEGSSLSSSNLYPP